MNKEMLKNAATKHPGSVLRPFDALMEKIGFDSLYEIIDEFGGSIIYIPAKRKVFKGCLMNEIHSEFDGENYRYLAKKYDYSVKGIRDALNPKKGRG